MKNRYIALVHKEDDTEYGVSFPDFPGCTALGENYDLALDNAAKALAEHVAILREYGEDIPEASSLEAIRQQEDLADDLESALVAIVPLITVGGEKVRVNLSIDKIALEAIDAAAKRRKTDRSSFLAEVGLTAARAF